MRQITKVYLLTIIHVGLLAIGAAMLAREALQGGPWWYVSTTASIAVLCTLLAVVWTMFAIGSRQEQRVGR